MTPLKNIALVYNAQKDGTSGLTAELVEIARKAGVKTAVTGDHPLPKNFLNEKDACCVIGGDGTLLGIAAHAAREHVPVIGINCGHLGFLTTFSADEARSCLADLLEGNYQLTQRTLLQFTTPENHTELALNEVLIKDEINSRIVHLEVRANDRLVTEYYSDGLIFATPTGSTAYNLSAGGPLVHPDANVIAMTPICPHTLSNRSIIFPQNTSLEIRNLNPDTRPFVSIDGRINITIPPQTPISIAAAPHQLQLIQRRDYSHYAILRQKLHWQGALPEKTK